MTKKYGKPVNVFMFSNFCVLLHVYSSVQPHTIKHNIYENSLVQGHSILDLLVLLPEVTPFIAMVILELVLVTVFPQNVILELRLILHSHSRILDHLKWPLIL